MAAEIKEIYALLRADIKKDKAGYIRGLAISIASLIIAWIICFK